MYPFLLKVRGFPNRTGSTLSVYEQGPRWFTINLIPIVFPITAKCAVLVGVEPTLGLLSAGATTPPFLTQDGKSFTRAPLICAKPECLHIQDRSNGAV